jgi:hypothetical protein
MLYRALLQMHKIQTHFILSSGKNGLLYIKIFKSYSSEFTVGFFLSTGIQFLGRLSIFVLVLPDTRERLKARTKTRYEKLFV